MNRFKSNSNSLFLLILFFVAIVPNTLFGQSKNKERKFEREIQLGIQALSALRPVDKKSPFDSFSIPLEVGLGFHRDKNFGVSNVIGVNFYKSANFVENANRSTIYTFGFFARSGYFFKINRWQLIAQIGAHYNWIDKEIEMKEPFYLKSMQIGAFDMSWNTELRYQLNSKFSLGLNVNQLWIADQFGGTFKFIFKI